MYKMPLFVQQYNEVKWFNLIYNFMGRTPIFRVLFAMMMKKIVFWYFCLIFFTYSQLLLFLCVIQKICKFLTSCRYRFFLLLKVLFLLSLASPGYSAEPYLNFGFGMGLAKIGESQNYSPVNGVINHYSSNSGTKLTAPLISLEAGYRINIKSKYYTSFGIEGDYINYGNPKGTLNPAINSGLDNDSLSYSYSAESYLLMLKNKWGFIDHKWLPYISLGVGLSFNQLTDYSESSNNSSAPAQYLYTRNTKKDIAYSIGVGIVSI